MSISYFYLKLLVGGKTLSLEYDKDRKLDTYFSDLEVPKEFRILREERVLNLEKPLRLLQIKPDDIITLIGRNNPNKSKLKKTKKRAQMKI